MHSVSSLKQIELEGVRRFVAGLPGPERPTAGLSNSGEALWVRGLHHAGSAEQLSLVLRLTGFPIDPPVGIYMLASATSARLRQALRRRLNVFSGFAAHGDPVVPGYDWLCFGYQHGWRYDAADPSRGDNLSKLLIQFVALMGSER